MKNIIWKLLRNSWISRIKQLHPRASAWFEKKMEQIKFFGTNGTDKNILLFRLETIRKFFFFHKSAHHFRLGSVWLYKFFQRITRRYRWIANNIWIFEGQIYSWPTPAFSIDTINPPKVQLCSLYIKVTSGIILKLCEQEFQYFG